jgi:hypothetical protein
VRRWDFVDGNQVDLDHDDHDDHHNAQAATGSTGLDL